MATVVSKVDYYIQTAKLIYITRVCQTSSTILVLYDHAITFDGEIDHVWTHPWSFGSMSYLFIRYVGDGLAIFHWSAYSGGMRSLFGSSFTLFFMLMDIMDSCEVYFYVQAWVGIMVFFLIQLVLQIRLYALYRGSRIVLAITMSCYLCEVAALSTIMGLVNADTEIVNETVGLYICADIRSPSFYQTYIFWVPVIGYDSILFLFAMWYGIRTWVSAYRRTETRWKGSVRTMTITDALVAGNVGYYFCIVVVCVLSIVLGQYLGLRWTEVFKGHPATVEVMLGCRLILSLRSSLVQDEEPDSYEITDYTPWAAVVSTATQSTLS